MIRWIILSFFGWIMFWPIPPAIAGQYKDLTAPEVKMMVEENGAMLINVLSRIEYDMQHIPGSINIPIIEVATSDKLPLQKETPIIFYCMGVR